MANNPLYSPLEQLIFDQLTANAAFAHLFGNNIYFEWNLDPQGMPYISCVPCGGGPNEYTMKQGNLQRPTITHPQRQFSVFSLDRPSLVTPDTGILASISQSFEALSELPMKDGSVCSAIYMRLDWQIIFEQAKQNILQRNCWHAFARFEFLVQRAAGAIC